MTNTCAVLFGLAVASSHFSSPFPSDIINLNIPNASHVIEESQKLVVRGMQLSKDTEIDQLINMGIDEVIIYKNDVKGDTTREKESLIRKGFDPSKIHHIPMRWKEVNTEEAFYQTMQALKVIVNNKNGVYFHCTLGEDRTGFLAGIYSLLVNEGSVEEVFQEEMCENGYEAGNKKKPIMIVDTVRKDLTPLFLQIAYMIKKGTINATTLDQVKLGSFASDSQLKNELGISNTQLKCKPSSHFSK